LVGKVHRVEKAREREEPLLVAANDGADLVPNARVVGQKVFSLSMRIVTGPSTTP
jgi:hypothetical protein